LKKETLQKCKHLQHKFLPSRFVNKSGASDWIIITGATSGIGLELAKLAMGLGHNILLISRDLEKLLVVQRDLHNRKLVTEQKIVVLDIDFSLVTASEYYERLSKIMEENQIDEVKLVCNNVGQGGFSAY
jgi:short-subunit dehydrogenase